MRTSAPECQVLSCFEAKIQRVLRLRPATWPLFRRRPMMNSSCSWNPAIHSSFQPMASARAQSSRSEFRCGASRNLPRCAGESPLDLLVIFFHHEGVHRQCKHGTDMTAAYSLRGIIAENTLTVVVNWAKLPLSFDSGHSPVTSVVTVCCI